jgi:transcriptional regulator with XRE-family HTH domain
VSLPVSGEVFATSDHLDTYGISGLRRSAIPIVSDACRETPYDSRMPPKKAPKLGPKPKATEAWESWGSRMRAHIKRRGLKWNQIAELMEMNGTSGSGIRHWLNGTRSINLREFFQLCTVVDADPAIILFNGPCFPLPEGGPLLEPIQSAMNTLKHLIDANAK